MTNASLASGSDVSIAAASAPSSKGRFWRRLRGERKVLIGLLIVAVLAFVAIFGPLLAPYDPAADEYELFAEPSMDHWLGTDSFGRDILSRMLAGTRVSFTVGISVALLSMAVGVPRAHRRIFRWMAG